MGIHLSQEDVESCIARVDSPARGVGFFIAPTLMLTCSHVISRDNGTLTGYENIDIRFRKSVKAAILYAIDQELDLALLGIPGIDPHASVYLSSAIGSGDKLKGWGWPDDFEKERIPADFEFNGWSDPDSGNAKLTFKPGRTIKPGWSGSPLWNIRTRKVCGVLDESHDIRQPDGASGISVKDIFGFLKESVSENSEIAKTILASHSLEDLGEFYRAVCSDNIEEGSEILESKYSPSSFYEILRDLSQSIKRGLQYKIDESKAEEILRKARKISTSVESDEFFRLFSRRDVKVKILRSFCKNFSDYADRLTVEHFTFMFLGIETQNKSFLEALPANLGKDFEKFTRQFISELLLEIYEIQEKGV